MKTQSYFDFTQEYYTRFPKSSYSISQFFLCRFFKDSSPHWELWNERDNRVAEDMIYKLILQYNWDIMNLQIVNEGGLIMMTPEIFQQALDVNKQIIECIFQQEGSFKSYLVEDLHYFRMKYPETYELERVHVSGHRFRITVIFEDMGELDLYIDAQDVYCWYEQEYKRLRG